MKYQHFHKFQIFFIIILLFIFFNLPVQINDNKIKIALCTMGKLENLYVEEYVNHYIKLGVDKYLFMKIRILIQKNFPMY